MVRESNQTQNTPFRSKNPCMSRSKKKIQALHLEKRLYATLQDHLGDITAWAFVWKQRRREVKVKLASDGPKFGTRFCEFEFNFSSTLFLDKSARSYVPQVVCDHEPKEFLLKQSLRGSPASRH